jgi:hypothetical protein
MFRVVRSPIIRGANNCIYSIWYLSHRYCYLPLSLESWNRFECAVGGLMMMGGSTTRNVASCWIYIGILLAHPILHISRIRVNTSRVSHSNSKLLRSVIAKFRNFEIVIVTEKAAGKRYVAWTCINSVNLML